MRHKQKTLEKLRRIADYQLGKGAGDALFQDNVKIVFSRTTGRIRHIYLKNRLLATLRPTDGMISLTVNGARQLTRKTILRHSWARVSDDAAPFIAKGKSIFSKHVVDSDPKIRPQEEVVVLSSDDRILAVGKAVLTGKEMKAFKRGLAVRARRGAAEK